MNTATKLDLEDLTAVMEDLVKRLPNLPLTAKIDVAARLKGITKACKEIDESVKDDIKEKLKGKEGAVSGEIFKSILKLVPTTRFDQKAFKEAQPKLYAKYEQDDEQARITFVPR